MKYKVYLKGSECRAPGFVINVPKESRYPFKFTATLDVNVGNNLVRFDVYPENQRSADKLSSVQAYVSRYNRCYPPLANSNLNSLVRVGKNRHKMWSIEADSASRFNTPQTLSGGMSYNIDLDAVDPRLLDPYYSLSMASYGQYAGDPEAIVTTMGDIYFAFKIVLAYGDTTTGFRAILASPPLYFRAHDVGGGGYSEIEEITYEEFAQTHGRFISNT